MKTNGWIVPEIELIENRYLFNSVLSTPTQYLILVYLTTSSHRTFDLKCYYTQTDASLLHLWSTFDWNRRPILQIRANFTFSTYLIVWPQITFDLYMWPLTSPFNQCSNVIQLVQDWMQLNFNVSNETSFTF